MTAWDLILDELRAVMPPEDFNRWFGATAYASDSHDQITVWVPSESIRRHITAQYDEAVRRAVNAIGRGGTVVRFVVGGTDEDEYD